MMKVVVEVVEHVLVVPMLQQIMVVQVVEVLQMLSQVLLEHTLAVEVVELLDC
jgi:hypothetical protein